MRIRRDLRYASAGASLLDKHAADWFYKVSLHSLTDIEYDVLRKVFPEKDPFSHDYSLMDAIRLGFIGNGTIGMQTSWFWLVLGWKVNILVRRIKSLLR